MVSARWRAQAGLICGAVVMMAAMSIVLAGAFEKPNLLLGQPGSRGASFRLLDVSNNTVSLSSLRGNVVVLYFAAEPNSETTHRDIQRLAELSNQFTAKKEVKFVSVFSGAEDWSQTQLHEFEQLIDSAGPRCKVLRDPGYRISGRYQINKTATFVVIDAKGMIRYRGGIDDSSPDAPMAATSFTSTIDLLLAERPVASAGSPTVLSNIK